jgi:hypothetical protein
MGLSVYFIVWSVWEGNPRVGTSSGISLLCLYITADSNTKIKNGTGFDEFEIADDNKDSFIHSFICILKTLQILLMRKTRKLHLVKCSQKESKTWSMQQQDTELGWRQSIASVNCYAIFGLLGIISNSGFTGGSSPFELFAFFQL